MVSCDVDRSIDRVGGCGCGCGWVGVVGWVGGWVVSTLVGVGRLTGALLALAVGLGEESESRGGGRGRGCWKSQKGREGLGVVDVVVVVVVVRLTSRNRVKGG